MTWAVYQFTSSPEEERRAQQNREKERREREREREKRKRREREKGEYNKIETTRYDFSCCILF
jgi:hypothetical protein